MNNISLQNTSISQPLSFAHIQNNEVGAGKVSTTNTPIQWTSGAESTIVNAPQTRLITDSEKQKYNTVYGMVDTSNKQKLNELLSNGRLLDKKNSNDRSSVLDNLYKIATEQRVAGLDTKVVLNETVNTIHNPFVITQKFGDIPKKYQKEILDAENFATRAMNKPKISINDLDVRSNCCVAASIEFDLAFRMPAEFARMIAGLTSEKMSVEKVIETKSVASNYIDSMVLLDIFNADPQYLDAIKKVKLELKPDKNAIIRARIQNSCKDPGERSVVDVLMQSMIMNIGSSKTYNTLTDSREGQFDKGLADAEMTFTKSLVTGENNTLVTYQKIDENMTLLGHECPLDEIKKHITDSLEAGQNVIIGYTYLDSDGKINQDGHEITILGLEKDSFGNEYFVCKDTDNKIQEPIKYEVSEFLPMIHHAGIPMDVLKANNVEIVEGWQVAVDKYNPKNKNGNNQNIQNAV